MQPDDRPPNSERDVIRRAANLITDRLPREWSAELREEGRAGGRRADAVLTVQAPDGSRAQIVVEAKRALETRDAIPIAEQLNAMTAELADGDSDATGLLAAPYINPATRVRLTELGVGYADSTGNLSLDPPSGWVGEVGLAGSWG